MLFHIVAIKIQQEFAEIEFANKKIIFFHLWVCFLTKYFNALYKGFWIYAKKTEKLFFDVKISCVYRIFYDHEFFVHVRITFKYLRFFLKVIGRKLTKIETLKPPSQNPCFGVWYDGYPRDFSGNVVGGNHFQNLRKASLERSNFTLNETYWSF